MSSISRLLHKIITHEGFQAMAITVLGGVALICLAVVPYRFMGAVFFGVLVALILTMIVVTRLKSDDR